MKNPTAIKQVTKESEMLQTAEQWFIKKKKNPVETQGDSNWSAI